MRVDTQVENILDGALACVSRLGFEKTRMDDVVAEAGVSRSTVYRRFKSREQIFETLLVKQAQPFIAKSQSVIIGPGSFRERLASLLHLSLTELSRMTWLKITLSGGVSPESFAVMASAQRSVASQVLQPFLTSGLASGEIRPGLNIDEVITWILRQILILGARELTADDSLRLVAQYILPVLAPDTLERPSPVETRLKRLEDTLERCRRVAAPTEDA